MKPREIELAYLRAIIERAEAGALSSAECQTLGAAIDTLAEITRELELKGASIRRLRQMLFGASTESSRNLFGDRADSGEASGAAPASTSATSGGDAEQSSGAAPNEPKAKRKGHGHNGSQQFSGAERITVTHPTLHHGDRCPQCTGKVYEQAAAPLIRLRGVAPIRATIWECEKLRCNLCQQIFTAPAPPGVGSEKYDRSVNTMVGLLRYGCGLPFNRIEKLQANFGIPLPATTQWDLVHEQAAVLAVPYDELIRQAAQGEVVYNDDTPNTILELGTKTRAQLLADGEQPGERTGVRTSGIVVTVEHNQIALFFTGRKHAGENLASVLLRRAAEREAPIQMSDALSHNSPGEFRTIVGNCLAHARRKFVEVAPNFPSETRQVIDILKEVYCNDAVTKAQKMTDQQRLSFHIEHSGPLMKDLETWLRAQITERKVEPNSGLGEAITYMTKDERWARFTLFLRVPGAPLDNTLCERALKKAILHRKNSLFFKTKNGARVGDLYMSFIHTAELNGVNPFKYINALHEHADLITDQPERWMPWNYQEAIAVLTAAADAEAPVAPIDSG
jgi:transposase